jgi:hypothetical protein
MARFRIADSAPSIEPTGAPNVSYNPRAPAEAFGTGIAEATQKAGQTLEHVGAQAIDTQKFFDQVQGDDLSTQFTEKSNKITHGDPNATTIGPDGKPIADLGYYGLKGEAALNARKGVEG